MSPLSHSPDLSWIQSKSFGEGVGGRKEVFAGGSSGLVSAGASARAGPASDAARITASAAHRVIAENPPARILNSVADERGECLGLRSLATARRVAACGSEAEEDAPGEVHVAKILEIARRHHVAGIERDDQVLGDVDVGTASGCADVNASSNK
jgi:hypothetical protein